MALQNKNKIKLLGEVEDFNYLYGMKECNKCNTTKEPTEFYKNKNCKDGLNSWCKKCHIEYRKQYYHTSLTYHKYHNKWGSGVYAIFEYGTCLYVGESITLKKRIKDHIGLIQANNTKSLHENLYNKLRKHSSFVVGILEETSNHKEREQYWINKLKPEYNA